MTVGPTHTETSVKLDRDTIFKDFSGWKLASDVLVGTGSLRLPYPTERYVASATDYLR